MTNANSNIKRIDIVCEDAIKEIKDKFEKLTDIPISFTEASKLLGIRYFKYNIDMLSIKEAKKILGK